MRSQAVERMAVGPVPGVSKPTMHLNHAEISGVQLATLPPSLGIVMTVVTRVQSLPVSSSRRSSSYPSTRSGSGAIRS